jgi:hypothetical protein
MKGRKYLLRDCRLYDDVLTDLLSHLAAMLQDSRIVSYVAQWSTVGANVLHAEETFIFSSVDKAECTFAISDKVQPFWTYVANHSSELWLWNNSDE